MSPLALSRDMSVIGGDLHLMLLRESWFWEPEAEELRVVSFFEEFFRVLDDLREDVFELRRGF